MSTEPKLLLALATAPVIFYATLTVFAAHGQTDKRVWLYGLAAAVIASVIVYYAYERTGLLLGLGLILVASQAWELKQTTKQLDKWECGMKALTCLKAPELVDGLAKKFGQSCSSTPDCQKLCQSWVQGCKP